MARKSFKSKSVESSFHRLIHTSNPFIRAMYVLAGLLFFIVGASILWVAFTPIPALNSFDPQKVADSTKIYDRNGTTILYDLNHNMKRQVIPLSDISPNLQHATIAIEDAHFYEHGGISFTGIARSFFVDLVRMNLSQGGSTLTQQVVKNTILTGKKSIIRKLQEWILAERLEEKYSKAKYLNFISM
jgi:penicillin-binding protein 1A